MRILLDTNILLRSVSVGHPQQSLANLAILKLKLAGLELFIVPQVIYEFWVVATRPVANNDLGYVTDEVDATTADYLQAFTLLGDISQIFSHWRYLVTTHGVSGKPAHDARLVAAIQAHGCDGILTFNAADFQRYQPLKILSPAEVIAV